MPHMIKWCNLCACRVYKLLRSMHSAWSMHQINMYAVKLKRCSLQMNVRVPMQSSAKECSMFLSSPAHAIIFADAFSLRHPCPCQLNVSSVWALFATYVRVTRNVRQECGMSASSSACQQQFAAGSKERYLCAILRASCAHFHWPKLGLGQIYVTAVYSGVHVQEYVHVAEYMHLAVKLHVTVYMWHLACIRHTCLCCQVTFTPKLITMW
jgi:hypothetical protein